MAFDIEVQRALTLKYIAYDPTTIALIPVVRSGNDEGGQSIVDGPPREPQTFKLIALTANQRMTLTVSGKERIIDYHLMGAYDSEMEVGDHWSDSDGNRYEVISIQAGHGYERKGFVEVHRSGDVV